MIEGKNLESFKRLQTQLAKTGDALQRVNDGTEERHWRTGHLVYSEIQILKALVYLSSCLESVNARQREFGRQGEKDFRADVAGILSTVADGLV